jgi:hypothetical protein
MDRFKLWAGIALLTGWCVASVTVAEPGKPAPATDPAGQAAIGEPETGSAMPGVPELPPSLPVPAAPQAPAAQPEPPAPRLPDLPAAPAAGATPATAGPPAPAVPVPSSPPRTLDNTPTPFGGSRTVPDAKPAAQPASAASADADARIRLCKAREHYYAGDLDEAQIRAGQLKQLPNIHWGYFEDSPDKLLHDIEQERLRRNQEASAYLLAEARALIAQGKLDEAEQKAREAASVYRATSLFARGDTAEKVLADIGAMRARARKEVPPSPTRAGVSQGRPQMNAGSDMRGALPPVGLRPPDPAGLPASLPDTTTLPTSVDRRGNIAPVSGVEEPGSAPAAPAALASHVPDSGPVARSLPQAPPVENGPSQTAAAQVSAAPPMLPAPTWTPASTWTPATAPAVQPAPSSLPRPSQGCPSGEWVCPFLGNLGWDCSGVHLNAEIGTAILWPYWKSNPAFVAGAAGPVAATRQTDFDYGAQFVPQISLGVQAAGGLGFRAGWWGFAVSDTAFATGPAASAAPLGLQAVTLRPTDSLRAFSHLRLDVWDFEATEDLRVGPWSLVVAGGVRYAHLAEVYNATVRDAAGAPVQGVVSGHNFNGAGPTLAFSVNSPLGGTGLYLYGDCRGSVLFGTAKQSASLLGGPTSTDTQDVSSNTHAVLPVGELELGLGWERDFGWAHVFVRGGLVGQIWHEAGNSSRSAVEFAPLGPVASSASVDSDLGLFGLALRAGIDY